MKRFFSLPRFGAVTLLCTTLSAQAHTGHGTHSLMEGLVHPFGMDHLLAMVAVGIWSMSTLPTRLVWQGPTSFLLALLTSATLGAMGFSLPFLEHAIALSVVLFGAMLVLRQSLPRPIGLGLIAAAASLHGLAHGVEAPESGFTGYAFGFVLTTAALHLGGLGAGLGIRRWLANHSRLALGGMGAAIAGAGLYLFTQV